MTMRIDFKLRFGNREGLGWPKAEMLRRSKGGTNASPSEYDFSGVPREELSPCVHYEYARESARIVEMVGSLREQFHGRLSRGRVAEGRKCVMQLHMAKFTKTKSPIYEVWYLLTLAARPGFPRVPWLDLKAEDKAALKGLPVDVLKMHFAEIRRNHPVFIADTVPDDRALPGMTLAAWEAKRMPALYRKIPAAKRRLFLVPGFFMVNTQYSEENIVDAFRKWLHGKHPLANKPAPEKRGRKSDRDRLNALGAMRLRFYCRALSEAHDLAVPLRKKEHGLYYSDRTAWDRACERGRRYFREVLEAAETDLPIHYSKGWRK